MWCLVVYGAPIVRLLSSAMWEIFMRYSYSLRMSVSMSRLVLICLVGSLALLLVLLSGLVCIPLFCPVLLYLIFFRLCCRTVLGASFCVFVVFIFLCLWAILAVVAIDVVFVLFVGFLLGIVCALSLLLEFGVFLFLVSLRPFLGFCCAGASVVHPCIPLVLLMFPGFCYCTLDVGLFVW